MPGVVFLVVIPTVNHERTIPNLRTTTHLQHVPLQHALNIAPEVTTLGSSSSDASSSRTAVRMEVELRAKKVPAHFRQGGAVVHQQPLVSSSPPPTYESHNKILLGDGMSMEELLQQLLTKLNIQHVSWTTAKGGTHHHVVFPLQAGDACETTLHCLTELRIGKARGTSVSVLPCSVNFDALNGPASRGDDDEEVSAEELSKWNCFVESIKSKLTVKQVVDGVRSGGALSFDYLLLIVTADSLAALGLVENNAPNITAAMLVSPLMGPVMSITFGAMIADRELIKSGFISLGVGMLISLVFGLIFGLILGSTEMPWGFGDWPTEEMKGRGNARSLWMGVLWALTSGTGVAVALLQGAVGPLIGVAISASLLPPVVNCGLFWSLSCTWLLKNSGNGTVPGTKIPHLKGEPFVGANTSYVPVYVDYLPVEFFINGIVSCMLTVINVICIFITAIVVLKIKEVAAPYTASPDLRRFWETDIRTVRATNRSTMRRQRRGSGATAADPFDIGRSNSKRVFDKPMSEFANADPHLAEALQNALKQLSDDETFRKVRRMSYSGHTVDAIPSAAVANAAANSSTPPIASLRNSVGLAHDLKAMEQLLSTMTQRQMRNFVGSSNSATSDTDSPQLLRRTNSGTARMPTILEKIAARSSSIRRSKRGKNDGDAAGIEEMINLTQNVLD